MFVAYLTADCPIFIIFDKWQASTIFRGETDMSLCKAKRKEALSGI